MRSRSTPEHVRQVVGQFFPEYSEAAKFWDSLSPAWRGVVLHAATLCGKALLKSSLANCNWSELHARAGRVEMMQLRSGIERGVSMFKGFGSLREQDFESPESRRINSTKSKVEQDTAPVVSEPIANLLAIRSQVRQQKTQGQQA